MTFLLVLLAAMAIGFPFIAAGEREDRGEFGAAALRSLAAVAAAAVTLVLVYGICGSPDACRGAGTSVLILKFIGWGMALMGSMQALRQLWACVARERDAPIEEIERVPAPAIDREQLQVQLQALRERLESLCANRPGAAFELGDVAVSLGDFTRRLADAPGTDLALLHLELRRLGERTEAVAAGLQQAVGPVNR